MDNLQFTIVQCNARRIIITDSFIVPNRKSVLTNFVNADSQTEVLSFATIYTMMFQTLDNKEDVSFLFAHKFHCYTDHGVAIKIWFLLLQTKKKKSCFHSN